MSDGTDQKKRESGGQEELTNADRRRVLKKMGKYAAYTAPAVMAVLIGREAGQAIPAPAPAPVTSP